MSAVSETAPADVGPGETEQLLYVETRKWRAAPDREDGFGVEHYRFTLSDGSRYDVDRFNPDLPRYNTKVTYTTPWCTDLDGFNERIGAGLARTGAVAVAVSPERLRAADLPRRLGHLSLLHDVEAHHAILDYLDDREVRPNGPKEVISVGYSRGAMVGFGLNSRSAAHGRFVRYSDYLDPCLEHEVRLRDIDWKNVPRYVAEEAAALGKGLRHYTPAELADLGRGALKPSVCFWLQQVTLAKTLFSGEAGGFVGSWHPDSVARINLYTRSRFNHAADWQQRFAHLDNVDIVSEPGLHLSGVDPRVLRGTIGRVLLAQELMKDNCSPAELHTQIAQWQPEPPKSKPVSLPHFPRLRSA